LLYEYVLRLEGSHFVRPYFEKHIRDSILKKNKKKEPKIKKKEPKTKKTEPKITKKEPKIKKNTS
jgi:hypothetical protein